MPPWLKKVLDWIGYISSAWTALGWFGWTSAIVGAVTAVAAFLGSAVENWSPTAVLLAGLAGGVLAATFVLLVGIAYRKIWPIRKPGDGNEDVFYSSAIAQTPPPPWTPLLTVRRWATEAGWNFDPNTGAMGHNSGWDFTNTLRQAAADGVVRFRGRRYTTMNWPEHSKGQEILVEIPTEHFKDYHIDPLCFVRATSNYDTFTGQLAKRKEQLTGQIYRDLEVDTAQIQTWVRDHKPSSTPPVSIPHPQKWLSVAEAIDEFADKKLLAAKDEAKFKIQEAYEKGYAAEDKIRELTKAGAIIPAADTDEGKELARNRRIMEVYARHLDAAKADFPVACEMLRIDLAQKLASGALVAKGFRLPHTAGAAETIISEAEWRILSLDNLKSEAMAKHTNQIVYTGVVISKPN